ncbi:unnamed protein product [Camellia sinensis]
MGMPAYLQPDLEANLVLPSTPAGSVNYQGSWLWGGLPVQLYQAWLLILYTGLALRENILRVNGSDIHPCILWIKHHYFAMAMALISLTWEIEREPEEGCNCSFNGLSCKELQCFYKIDINGKGFVHILHSQVLSAVYFARVSALGCVLFVKPCRPAWLGEWTLFGEKLLELTVNYGCWHPFYSYYSGFEAYVGILLLKVALAGVVSEWQVVTCGVLLIVMAVGNFANTVQTLVAKSRFKAKMKKTKSKVELN